MTHSSFLGGERSPQQPSGSDLASLGPSDLSDSGSDTSLGATDLQALVSDSDSTGTGERASVDDNPVPGADILPDHLERARENRSEAEDGWQAELDLDEAAEPEEAQAEIPWDHPDLVDTPADVAGLAQEAADADEEPAEEAPGFQPAAEPARRGSSASPPSPDATNRAAGRAPRPVRNGRR